MSLCELKLGYPPTVNTYYRMVNINGSPRALLSKKGRLYKMQCAAVAAETGVLNMGFTGPVELWLYYAAPDKKKRDLDNVLKAVLDGITYSGVIIDDSQVVSIHAYKGRLNREDPHCLVQIVALDKEDREETPDVADSGEIRDLAVGGSI